MAVSEPEKKADKRRRPANTLNSSQRGVSSNGGETSYLPKAGNVEEVCPAWQPYLGVRFWGGQAWRLGWSHIVLGAEGARLSAQNYLQDKLASPVAQHHGTEAYQGPLNGCIAPPSLDVSPPQ